MNGEQKVYGVYINPFPGVWFSESRIKSEARQAGYAWWVNAESEKAAWNEMLAATADKETRDKMESLMEKGSVFIEFDAPGESGAENEGGKECC